MPGEVAAAGEALPALDAHVRPLDQVRPQVDLEVHLVAEAHLALVTRVRLLALVAGQDMFFELLLVRELHATLVARIQFMSEAMLLVVTVLCKGFVAMRAGEELGGGVIRDAGERVTSVGVRPRVHLEIAVPGEALSALLAAERLLARVHQHVPLEVDLVDEALIAHVAAVRPVAGVGPVVAPQVAAAGEPLPAVRALEGAFARVQHEVPLEVHVVGEAVAALRALERLLARVGHHVAPQVAPPREALAALLAREGPLAGVGHVVALEVDVVQEALAALRALVRLLAQVRHVVAAQMAAPREALAALDAREGLEAGVRLGVALELEAVLEALAAFVADERLDVCVRQRMRLQLVHVRELLTTLAALVLVRGEDRGRLHLVIGEGGHAVARLAVQRPVGYGLVGDVHRPVGDAAVRRHGHQRGHRHVDRQLEGHLDRDDGQGLLLLGLERVLLRLLVRLLVLALVLERQPHRLGDRLKRRRVILKDPRFLVLVLLLLLTQTLFLVFFQVHRGGALRRAPRTRERSTCKRYAHNIQLSHQWNSLCVDLAQEKFRKKIIPLFTDYANHQNFTAHTTVCLCFIFH